MNGLAKSAKKIIKHIYYQKVPFTWRMSPVCRRWYNSLLRTQYWNEEEMRDYQLSRLKAIVNHACKNVDWYRDKFRDIGIDRRDVNTLDDIRYLPLLSKEDLQQFPSAFVAHDIPKEDLHYMMSGGTTGKPTGFYHIRKYNDEVVSAAKLALWQRIGCSPKKLGLFLERSFNGNPLRYAPRENRIYLSISGLTPKEFPDYISTICSAKPVFLSGYPSSLTAFAQLVKDYPDLRFQGIISASEVLYNFQRQFLVDVFQTRVFEWYGLSEGAGFAAGCEWSDDFHFLPQIGYVELLGENGLPVTQEGEEGEIVLTGFLNIATPFIRYRTGDRGTFGGKQCSSCGREHFLVKRILGRMQEYLVGSEGRLISISALNIHSNLLEHVRAFQFYQEEPGKIIIRIAKKDAVADECLNGLRDEMQRRLGANFSLSMEFVEEIPKTGHNKHKFVVQKVQRKKSNA